MPETSEINNERKTQIIHAGQLENLTKNIPGGAHRCANDQDLTLLSMSDGFFSMFGYTETEIGALFQGRFINMVYPQDRTEILESIKKQLKKGPEIDLEYRVLCKNGKPLWVLDKGRLVDDVNGTSCFYCLLIEITERKQQQEELRLSLERHQVIMNQTTDIIFEWDIRKDTLDFSTNWRKKFGYDPIREGIGRKVPLSKNIHPDDMPAFVKIMEDTAAGIPYSEAEFRIRDALGSFIWSRIRATTQYDMQGKPIKAVGVILDIDADKRQKQRLLEQARRDALTNLYNKSAIRELVEQKMAESTGGKSQAMLIIDVDNFKQVNDTYGHLCGDSLLSDVAETLRGHFRFDGVVGRIGGDEFLVYLPEMEEKKEVAAKTRSLLDALHTLKPLKNALPISCSVGIALFPQKGADYYALYKCADAALYQMKARGKNGFLFFSPKDCGGMIPSGYSHSAVGVIDSEVEGVVDEVGEKLAKYVFQMLYASIDVNTAVNRLLEIVGRAYDVSRVYIFESSADGKRCSNTFEWCNTGILSEIQKLQNIDYEKDLGGYQQNFNENHIFYCTDIRSLNPNLYNVLAPQGICSLLQSAILDDGEFMGYVGFDECRENRRWTKEQVNSLTLISNVLSTFLVKLRLKERLTQQSGTRKGQGKGEALRM